MWHDIYIYIYIFAICNIFVMYVCSAAWVSVNIVDFIEPCMHIEGKGGLDFFDPWYR